MINESWGKIKTVVPAYPFHRARSASKKGTSPERVNVFETLAVDI